MPLAPGTRLGPYEVLAPLGAGGMGEVYRARDSRLGRDVAIKVLPEGIANDRRALARLESEARAVAALSHPHILSLFDVGEATGVRYVVTELLQGETLRAALERGALPVRRALEVAEQVARALAAAHECGIVHRDVKPENVFLTKDGSAKLLDFGLARAPSSSSDPEVSSAPTAVALTETGALVGTVAYMSPEQTKGLEVDHRSDQFSLGITLYEMLAGSRPFRGASAAETLAAILREEPEPLSRVAPGIPPPLQWLVERCLAKEADGRYDSTRDLARDLAHLRSHLSEASSPGLEQAPSASVAQVRRRAAFVGALVVVLAGAALWGGLAFLGHSAQRSEPRFQRLTFKRGHVTGARFAPDGQTVVYSAAWDGQPSAVYSIRLDALDPIPSGYPGARLLAVSPTTQLALSLKEGLSHAWFAPGTLALAPFSGGAPRPLDPEISFADFSLDGETLAVVRGRRGLRTGSVSLEYPAGTVLRRSGPADWPSDVRLSPSGERLAFADNTFFEWAGGYVVVTDRSGKTLLRRGPFVSLKGLAWSPRGDEVWFSGGPSEVDTDLRAISLEGRERVLLAGPGLVGLHDVARDGRVLASTIETRCRVFFRREGVATDRDLSAQGYSEGPRISPDGKWMVLADASLRGQLELYLRPTSGGPAIRLGKGQGGIFAGDSRSLVVTQPDRPALLFQPVGPGQPKTIPLNGFTFAPGNDTAGVFPDGKALWFMGSEPSRRMRTWRVDLSGGKPRPLTPEGEPMAVMDDGESMGAWGDGRFWRRPVGESEARPVEGLLEGEAIATWTPDGKPLFVYATPACPARVYRLDPKTGAREFFREIGPPDCTGVQLVLPSLTPDGKACAYEVWEWLSELYLIEGLK